LTYRTPFRPTLRQAAVLVFAAAQTAAWAQSGEAPASAASAASAAARTDEARAKAEADEAMARARRLAANPMRMIVEASRIRRRAEDAGVVVPVSAAIGSPAAAGAEAPATRSLPVADQSAEAQLSSQLASERVQPAPALALTASPTALSLPAAALPSLPALAAEIPKPTLVKRVNPEVPARLLAELPSDTVFVADLTILPDGSVGAVEPVPPVPRTVQRYVVQALQQWRFEPLPSERVWRVELQFRLE
jgi:hypothetical protein